MTTASGEAVATAAPQVGLVGRAWGFVKWHKVKFVVLGSLTALGVGGYYYAKRMLLDGMRQVEELGRGLQEKMMEGQHRANELARVRAECARMIQTFVPPLRATVKQLTDPKPVTERLKSVRSQRKSVSAAPAPAPEEEDEVKRLWDELKVVSLARLVASVYALALLNALLRVQLHVLGRNAFEEAAEHRKALAKSGGGGGGVKAASAADAPAASDSSSSSPSSSSSGPAATGNEPSRVTRKVRERFLFSGSDHLMNTGEGMQLLVKRVHAGIERASRGWLMGTNATVSRLEVLDMLDAIRGEVECAAPAPAPALGSLQAASQNAPALRLPQEVREWAAKCLIPADEEAMLGAQDRELDAEQNAFLRSMLEETLDMVESPNFALVLQTSFDCLFGVLRSDLAQRAFEAYVPPGQAAQAAGHEVFLLTKVIVSLKLVASDVLSEGATAQEAAESVTSSPGVPAELPPNQYERALGDLPPLDELCAAVFQQGAEPPGGQGGLDALGLGDLGIGEDDLRSIAGLLGGFGGGAAGQGPSGMPSEAELMRLLGGDLAGGGMAGAFSGAPQQPGMPSEADLVRLLGGLAGQGRPQAAATR